MARVRVFHWKAGEAEPLLEAVRQCGYDAVYAGEQFTGGMKAIAAGGFHALVIDLTRLPSHGRTVGLEVRAHKSTCHLPLVYVDGEAEKVDRIRKELPDAMFTTRAKLAAALKKARPVGNPVVTKPMMESYGGRTTAQKMGIKEGSRVGVMDPPKGYAKILGELPAGVSFEENPETALPVTLWFVHDPDAYLASLPAMRKVAAGKSKLWVLWPKAASKKGAESGVTQNLVREAGIQIGLVDYKICSVNETWSGVAFALKKT